MKGRPNSPSQRHKAYILLKLSRKESEKHIMLPANELSASPKSVFPVATFFFSKHTGCGTSRTAKPETPSWMQSKGEKCVCKGNIQISHDPNPLLTCDFFFFLLQVQVVSNCIEFPGPLYRFTLLDGNR